VFDFARAFQASVELLARLLCRRGGTPTSRARVWSNNSDIAAASESDRIDQTLAAQVPRSLVRGSPGWPVWSRRSLADTNPNAPTVESARVSEPRSVLLAIAAVVDDFSIAAARQIPGLA